MFFLELDESGACHTMVGEDKDQHERGDESEVVIQEVKHGIHRPLLDFKYNRSVNLTGASKFEERDDDATDKGGDHKAPGLSTFSDHTTDALFEKRWQLKCHILDSALECPDAIAKTQHGNE